MAFTMTFNGKILPIKISSVEGRGPLSVDVFRQGINNKDGAYFQGIKIPERFLKVSFTMKSKGLSENRTLVENLNKLLFVNKPMPIIFSDEPDKTYYGILEGEQDWEEKIVYGKGSLYFICLDPFKYGAEKTLTVLTNNSISNDGIIPVAPIINVIFTVAATEYKIQHTESGGFVRVVHTFAMNDRLEIDLMKRKILINGLVRMTAYDWKSVPFNLVAGSNRFTVPSGSNTTIKFKPKYF